MRAVRTITIVAMLALITLGQGCHRGVVATTPERGQTEVEEIYPSRRKVWIPGKVTYHNGKYIWRSGRYKSKSSDKPVLVAAHWKKTPRGYKWVPARWKKF